MASAEAMASYANYQMHLNDRYANMNFLTANLEGHRH